MSLDTPQFNITEGRVAFVVKAGQAIWNDGQTKILMKLAKNSDFISLVKNDNNQIVFVHFSVEDGQTILTVEAKDLPSNRDLPFILSWSVADKKIGLSINGTLKKDVEDNPDVCDNCGHTPETGACFCCKMD